MQLKALYAAVAAVTALACNTALAAAPATVDFSHGMEGWYGDGAGSNITSGIDSSLGNGTPSFHAYSPGSQFALKTYTSPDFIGDYTALKSFTFSLDITVAELAIGASGGAPLAQDLVLEFRDYDKPSKLDNYSSVWVKLGTIGDGQPATQHLSVTVTDATSSLLPAGWHGYGEEGPNGELQLPYAQTFRRLLSDVDEVVISTAVPGYIYGAEQFYNLSVDNITLAAAVPEPTTYAMLLAGLGLVGWSARRRRA